MPLVWRQGNIHKNYSVAIGHWHLEHSTQSATDSHTHLLGQIKCGETSQCHGKTVGTRNK
eukprot:3530607-Amphidinium_carterae.1